MASIEDKLEKVNEKFRYGSAGYKAARYIVRQGRELPKEERDALEQEIGIKTKNLEAVITKLKKLGLYGDAKIDFEIPKTSVPIEVPEEISIVKHSTPQVPNDTNYVTLEDFNDFKEGINESLNKALNQFIDNVVNDGAEPEESMEDEQNYDILQPDEMSIRDPSLTRKSIWLKPKTQMYYDLARQGVFVTYADTNELGPFREFGGNISDFFNIIVDDYFIRNYNADIGILMRRYIK